MDHNVAAAQRLFENQEQAAERACQVAATAAGLSKAHAEDCEDGQRGCPACPWARSQRLPQPANGEPS